MAEAKERSSPSMASAPYSPRGRSPAIMGPSGSGKSTFLNVAAGLDRPTSGNVALGDADLAQLSERRLTILRRERIGFVFQAFNLLPSLTVAQNIALPLRLDGRRPRYVARRRAGGRDARRPQRRRSRRAPRTSGGLNNAASRRSQRSWPPRRVHRRADRALRRGRALDGLGHAARVHSAHASACRALR
jgi:ABC-type sugar transport system ATPase subunit